MNAAQRATKILLNESEMPTAWYNVAADLPKPMDPALHPATGQPLGPQDLAPLFPMELIRQEGPWQGLDDVEFATLCYVDWFNRQRPNR